MAAVCHRPHIGIAALISNAEGKVVLGKRKGSHGAGTWACPGGHLEYGETFFSCAERETLEETGLKVVGKRVVATTNDVMEDAEKHYVTIFIACELEDPTAQPKVMEPQKCEEWSWIEWDQIKRMAVGGAGSLGANDSLFLPLVNLIKVYYQDTD